ECGERQMLVQHLDRLSSKDLLLLDRGYPSRWLVALLNERAISCAFLRSGLDEQVVTLTAPSQREAADYEFTRAPQQVRLVRHIAPNGKVRVLMTNLFDTARFPASAFGDLYHKRWRIEEAFKRLKSRLNLE
ncbi:transposase, partial [Massilia genomosp. 1]